MVFVMWGEESIANVTCHSHPLQPRRVASWRDCPISDEAPSRLVIVVLAVEPRRRFGNGAASSSFRLHAMNMRVCERVVGGWVVRGWALGWSGLVRVNATT